MGRTPASFRKYYSERRTEKGGVSTCLVRHCGQEYASRASASLELHHYAAHVVPALEEELHRLRGRLAAHGEDIPAADIATLLGVRPAPKPSSTGQPTVHASFAAGAERNSSLAARAAERDVIITELIINNNLSFNMCESPEFVALMKHADRKYSPPTRKDVGGPLLDKLYTGAMRHLKQELPHFNYFGTTTDMWTSTPLDSYMAFIATGVDKNFNLRTFMAGCEPMQGKHTGANLAAAFNRAGERLNIRDRIGAVTADHARNNVNMADKLEKCDMIGCICHMLHLTVMDVLQPKKLKKTGYKLVPGAANTASLPPEPSAASQPQPEAVERDTEMEDETEAKQQQARRSKRSRTLSHKMQSWSGAPVSLVQAADEEEEDGDDEDPDPLPESLPQLADMDRLVPLNIISRTTALTVLFTTSSANKKLLKEKIMSDPFDNCMPKRYGMTRWDSFYFMLNTLVVHRKAVDEAVDQLANEHAPHSVERKKMNDKALTPDEWAQAKILCDVLKPFTVLNKKLQSARVTIHLVYRGLYNTLLKLSASSDINKDDFPGVSDVKAVVDFRERIKARLFGVLTYRISTMSPFEWAAFEAGAAFDPAMANVQASMAKLAEGDLSRPQQATADARADKVMGLLAKLHVSVTTKHEEATAAEMEDDDDLALGDDEPPSKRPRVDDDADDEVFAMINDFDDDPPSSQDERYEDQFRIQLVAYFSAAAKIGKDHPLAAFKAGTYEPGGVEKFWRAALQSDSSYSFGGYVADAARAVFAILAASAASERVFSATGLIVSDRRCNLGPDKVNKMAVVKTVSTRFATGSGKEGRFRPYITQRAGELILHKS